MHGRVRPANLTLFGSTFMCVVQRFFELGKIIPASIYVDLCRHYSPECSNILIISSPEP